ncbi:MAG: 5-(carboxyamino)imidazole ribonucleotide synthase, partial [Candidatus Eremiobacteraeota bacterium]|nr:5-(carboxyamino)imidazole ribonucleotide synthase [Candidatus Eremiobacteraeota bacterium]
MISTLGVIGGGQLGRMFALDAKRMGYSVIVLDPVPHSPCGQVADEQIVAAYDDMDAIDDLGRRTDVVTYEFENIAIASVERLERSGYSVAPGSDVLRITQNRLLEKTFLRSHGIPIAEFAAGNSLHDINEACGSVGFPMVIKTCSGGYDGKGQWRVNDAAEARRAFAEAKGAALICEAFVSFEREISVVATRNAADRVVTYPPGENEHDDGILSMTIAPARVSEEAASRARAMTESIARNLEIVGTFCVEFFLNKDGELLVNEIAPRPHNSGHYTMNATVCSQYEQHIRAICALPLSSPQLIRNAVMMNILGAGQGDQLCGVDELLRDPSVVLHI